MVVKGSQQGGIVTSGCFVGVYMWKYEGKRKTLPPVYLASRYSLVPFVLGCIASQNRIAGQKVLAITDNEKEHEYDN